MKKWLKYAKKAILAFLISLASVLGIKYYDIDWWISIFPPLINGIVVYWTRNAPDMSDPPSPSSD